MGHIQGEVNDDNDDEALLFASGLDHREWGGTMRAEIAKILRNLLPSWPPFLLRLLGLNVALRYAGVRVFQTGRGQQRQCVIVVKGDYRFAFDGVVAD